MESRKTSKAVDSSFAQVKNYELMCVENPSVGGVPNEERIRIAFRVLDDLVPKLGVYTRIFTKIKDDLFDAVYSEDLTTHTDGTVTKIPYFTLMKRIFDERDDKQDLLSEQLEEVKRRLFDKHKQFEESQQKIAQLEENIEELNHKIEGQEEDLRQKEADITRVEEELKEERERSEDMEQRLEGDINDLQDSLDEAHQEIENLARYKKGYDDLYYAFLETGESSESLDRKIKPVISTKRANLMNNIEAAQKLEDQIMSVMNTAVEEFDKFLEEHKSELMKIDDRDDLTDAEYEVQEMDIEQADQELEAVQERFKFNVGDISNELALLKEHCKMLMKQLEILEQNKPTVTKRKGTGKMPDPAGLNKSDSILSAGLNDDNDDEEGPDADPFIPQERVFSKYAAMLYSSNNQGRSFEEFKDAKFCPSCGEKTVICPHKLPGSDKVIVLPHNCTHLKITRPKVRINKELIEEIMKPQTPEYSLDMPSTAGTYTRHMDSIPIGHTPATSRESPSLVGSEAHLQHTMHRMFDDYKDRAGELERKIPRMLSIGRTLSQIEQFWAYMLEGDKIVEEKDFEFSVLDRLYLFMQERYLIDDIMYLCTHDLLSAIAEYSSMNKTIQVFGNVLCGNLDGACFRYMMLMCDFITVVEWKEVEDFRAFAHVVYPFMGEDDLETLHMSYTSFSENKISPQLVCQFLMHLILKYREPCFQEMEHKIIPVQGGQPPSQGMTWKEFNTSLDEIVTTSSERLRKKLFKEAEVAARFDGYRDTVPLMRLSQIAGYLNLDSIAKSVRENIARKVVEWRERPSSSSSGKGVQHHEGQLVVSDEKLITMANVKLLANNVNRFKMYRRARIRRERWDNQDDDWPYYSTN
ncbi:uncharacterized protein LOC128180193 isoform X4 [Crassostrea angulata]|uniref:uncharacterized protein LOC128180193 isoform X4 n=1 Tax=Magallana angulata TaxID=2784310 RepID=UPI0009752F08|nr:uncharacterized protein LOC105325362 isoform X4 [Crassostrea gigas]XP_052704066.1 uncharacterized protein LOC128180193 isoform X4 [Crassostrea angulata]|eukprot:XP_011423616.2 PREDICTED: uncharacterized protein LOC105325649 [Crassostrea gigas]